MAFSGYLPEDTKVHVVPVFIVVVKSPMRFIRASFYSDRVEQISEPRVRYPRNELIYRQPKPHPEDPALVWGFIVFIPALYINYALLPQI